MIRKAYMTFKQGRRRELVRNEEVRANSNGLKGVGSYAEMMQLARAAEKVEGQISKRVARCSYFNFFFGDFGCRDNPLLSISEERSIGQCKMAVSDMCGEGNLFGWEIRMLLLLLLLLFIAIVVVVVNPRY